MDQVIAEILKAGFLGALLLLQGWYFIRKEERLFLSLEKKDESRRIEQEQHHTTLRDEQRIYHESICDINDKMIDMITEHTKSITQIAETIDHLAHMMDQLEIYLKEQQVMRRLMEQKLGIRSGQTEKFYMKQG